jgi:hypothetical protein
VYVNVIVRVRHSHAELRLTGSADDRFGKSGFVAEGHE